MREMKKSEEGIKITQYMLNEEGERRLRKKGKRKDNTRDGSKEGKG